MTITPTALLSLPIITTGTESGTWGDVVDNGLTAYLDIAIAGGLAISITGTGTVVTLANTAGTSSATGITSTTAQYAILNISGAKTGACTLNLPISSKWYIINNSAATGGFLLTVRGVTPTTGVTLVDGEKAIVAWNGTDYVKIASSLITTMSGILPVANGGTGLSSGTSGGVLYYSASGTIATSAALAASALVVGGGAGITPATTTTGTGVVTALGVNVGTAGAFVVNGGALGTPSSGTLSSVTVDGTNAPGYINIPQNAQTGNYTLVLADAGKHIYHDVGAGAATYTIPANASVAYVIGTAVTFINMSTNAVTIAITTDTLYWGGVGTTGSRTLVQYGVATCVKMTSTTWVITGSGLT
jgi:hypothetical protein